METSPKIALAVALEGAGWHPAAWRLPGARPAELFSGRYWVDLVQRGGAGRCRLRDHRGLDGRPVEAAGACPTTGPTGCRGRLDAVLIAARVAPTTRSLGLVPTATTTHTEPFHISKAIATLDYVSGGRGGVQVRVSPTALEARQFGRRAVADPHAGRRRAPGVPGRRRRSVRRGRRLHRGGPPALGQLGGRRRDPRRGHRALHRPRPPALHRLRGPLVLGEGPVHHPPAPPGPAAGGRTGPRARWPSGWPPVRPTWSSSPPTAPTTPRAIMAGLRTEEAAVGRTGPPLLVFADLVVFLDTEAGRGRGAQGPAGRAGRPALPVRCPCLHRHPGRAGRPAGRVGGRPGSTASASGPAAIPSDLEAITRQVVPLARERGILRRDPTAARYPRASGPSRPENRYADA